MRDLSILLIHLLATIIKLMGPGGVRSVAAESILIKQQLLILNRARVRAPNLRPMDRVIAALCATSMRTGRLRKSAIIIKPSTIMAFHRILVQRKYRRLFTPQNRGKPGPKGPSPELIAAIVETKQRNPRFGCRRIAQQIAYAFGIDCDKDLVRRVLAQHYRPTPGSGGPSWLSFLGHSKDSLWSVDFFRCESATLKSHWVMVIMDQCTRRIIGFTVHAGTLDGTAACRMFNSIAAGSEKLPGHLSSDNDPLFRYHRWRANLRVLDVSEIKTVPYVPLSHPFVERLIGTVRREYLDQVPFWSARDLENKLKDFQHYYNAGRVHFALNGHPPDDSDASNRTGVARLKHYRWQSSCRGLFQLPVPA